MYKINNATSYYHLVAHLPILSTAMAFAVPTVVDTIANMWPQNNANSYNSTSLSSPSRYMNAFQFPCFFPLFCQRSHCVIGSVIGDITVQANYAEHKFVKQCDESQAKN
uniref:Uncharacterized protein n=1 Tax=Glossina austeni TaxID=7395 RepID=A0A1A9UFL2_GLOAU